MPASANSVFVNVPFDRRYKKLFDAIVFAVHDCGFLARWAREQDDGSQVRLNKLPYHFERHGAEVGAASEAEYVSKAVEFTKNLKGARKVLIEGSTDGVIRSIKNGRYIDLAPDGRTISFGTVR